MAMKHLFIFFSLLCVLSGASQNAASVFTSDAIVYYGMDLSNCRLIGDFGATATGAEMKTNLFPQWNAIIVNEPGKYDFKTTFHKSSVAYDLGPVTSQNEKTDEKNILTTNANHSLDKATLEKMVKSYGTGEKTHGIGLVYIIETFDKTIKLATLYVTFFDIATHKILFMEKMREEPVGFGLKSFWAGAISKTMKDIKKTDYAEWEKKYKSTK